MQANNLTSKLSRAFFLTSLLALSVSACTASGTITPPPSPSPSTTPTVAPTAVPTVGPTNEPTPVPTATAIPEPTPTPVPTGALTMYALVTNPPNRLLRFSSATPSNVTAVNVVGIPAANVLVGIDFRPADGKLYGVTNGNRLVTIDVNTGTATVLNAAAFNPALNSVFIGFDFNPTVDRIRTHSSLGQNLRLNPITGAVAATDTNLSYADGDINAGATPAIDATAYTNSVAGATTTELYGIDFDRDTLVKLSDPNAGKISTVGPLGINTSNFAGFDIARDGRAFVALKPSNINNSVLYSVNLQTGTTTQIENIGTTPNVIGLAIAP